jgi:hypothetical protein
MICCSGVRTAESADEEVEPLGVCIASSSLGISVKHADGDDCDVTFHGLVTTGGSGVDGLAAVA